LTLRSSQRLCAALSTVSILMLASPGVSSAQSGPNLAGLQFLLGEWEGIGDQAGATGGFSFAPGVQNRVIVRTNFSNTPADSSHPASRHDDLMIVYVEGSAVRADYFDSEGHVIRYFVDARRGEAIFVSEIKPTEPRYRLTYTQTSATTISGRFEVAPHGKPEAFAPYLSWAARKLK
jgi:hypothetical protein